MSMPCLKFVFVGLSVTSWRSDHASTYRSTLKELALRGHEVTFLERDLEFYARDRYVLAPDFGRTFLYGSVEELEDCYTDMARDADLLVVGSYVPYAKAVGAWAQEVASGCCAFYDIDTQATLAKLAAGDGEHIEASQISRYALYLSFTGGPALECLARIYGSPCARPLYGSVDPELYYPERAETRWDLGYLGAYGPDRLSALERLLLEPARRWEGGRFAVAGDRYPSGTPWPDNVERRGPLSPADHRAYYNAQRYALSVTRAASADAGWAAGAGLLEAAASGTPVISERWPGLEALLAPGREVFVADTPQDALRVLRDLSDAERRAVAEAARVRVLAEHTATHRADELERYTLELHDRRTRRSRVARMVCHGTPT